MNCRLKKNHSISITLPNHTSFEVTRKDILLGVNITNIVKIDDKQLIFFNGVGFPFEWFEEVIEVVLDCEHQLNKIPNSFFGSIKVFSLKEFYKNNGSIFSEYDMKCYSPQTMLGVINLPEGAGNHTHIMIHTLEKSYSTFNELSPLGIEVLKHI